MAIGLQMNTIGTVMVYNGHTHHNTHHDYPVISIMISTVFRFMFSPVLNIIIPIMITRLFIKSAVITTVISIMVSPVFRSMVNPC